MFHFKRSEKRSPPFGERVVVKVINTQKKWADYLQAKAALFSLSVLRSILALFFIGSTSISIYIIVNSLQSKGPVVVITPIRLPQVVLNPGEESKGRLARITDKEYEALKRFQRYMDSLRETPQTRPQYDNIRRCRPGLIDSIQYLERLYHLQQSKK